MISEFDLRRDLGDVAYYSVIARNWVLMVLALQLNQKGPIKNSSNPAAASADVTKFGYLAKTGFQLTFRNDRNGAGLQLRRVLEETDMGDERTVLKMVEAILTPDQIVHPHTEPFLPIFGHALATLILLASRKKVSLADVDYFRSSDALELGKYGKAISSWNRDLSPENIWSTFNEVDQVLQRTTRPENATNPNSLIRVGHFLATATYLARKINTGYVH